MSFIYLFKQYWHYSGTDRWKIVVMYFLYIVTSFLMVAIPLVFAQVLNTLQTAPKNEILPGVVYWSFIWAATVLARSIVPRIARIFREMTAFRAKQCFINHHYNIVTKLPLSWHTDHHSGNTINRINTAAESLYQFASNQYIYIEHSIQIIGPVIALAYLGVGVNVFAMTIGFIVISFFAARYFDRKMIIQFRKLNEINHKIAATFYDFVSNIRTIITLKLGPKTERDLNEKIEDGYKTTIYVKATLDNIKHTTLFILTDYPRIGIVFYYIYTNLQNSGTVLSGNVAALFQYLEQIATSFIRFFREVQNLLRYRTDLEAVEPITSAACIADDNFFIKKNWKSISVHDLSFAYKAGKPILSDINFEIRRGKKIAVIGESGSGKSTLMALIRGLYQTSSGYLCFDGAKKKHPFASLSAIASLMPQDPEIFENTIRYNITMGLNYTEQQVMQAVRLARFERVLEKLPHGLESDIREKGVNFSGGERQRLALARNILASADSDIILMDEPTSSVDMTNEKAIYQNIFKQVPEKTIISSVHKLYLLPMFDYVIEIEKGKIIRQEVPDKPKNQAS